MSNWTRVPHKDRKGNKKKLSRRERLALPPEKRRPPGRPPGIHTKHRSPQERRQYLVEKYGCPVEFMMMGMADTKNKKDVRFALAKDAAPYVAEKLSAVTLSGDPDKPIETRDLSKLSDADLAKQYTAMIQREKRGKDK